MSLIERLQGLRASHGQEPPPFKQVEQARKVMEEAGGRKLMLRVAEELKENGDTSVIVIEEDTIVVGGEKKTKHSFANKITLRYDLQEDTSNVPAGWYSKEVSIVAVPTGIFIEFSYFPGFDPVSLSEVISIAAFKITNEGRPINLTKMSLEEQLKIAVKYADYIQDFRYEEGKSPEQRPVKSNFSSSRRIF